MKMKSLILFCLFAAIFANAQLVADSGSHHCPEHDFIWDGPASFCSSGSKLGDSCGSSGLCHKVSESFGSKLGCGQCSASFVVVPSFGKCPEGTELSEQECEHLGPQTRFSIWQGAGTWSLPETCGCYVDQLGGRYFNRFTGACDRPEFLEQMICKPIQNDLYEVVRSVGKCPQGTELSEQECKDLGDGKGFSKWGGAGTWSAPESCGCFIDQDGSRYFNRLTGACDNPDNFEHVICKKPTPEPSQEPTQEPSQEPTGSPSFTPTHEPTQEPTEDTLKLEECISVCEANTCEEDGPHTMGTNQMLTCTNACFMRHIGASNSECLGHCDRHGGSGCFLKVNDVNFNMCGVISGSPCFHGNHVSVSDCELGCNSYLEETSPQSPHEQLKAAVKAAFDSIKSPENKKALPGLIRKAFHDAGHFDQNSGDVRMGCIQNFLGHPACPQHGHLEDATSVVNAVMNQIPSDMVLSMADAVQLLGALAVDELAQGTGAAPLYGRVRTGRVDPTTFTCIENIQMCKNLPTFFTRHHSQIDHADIVISLNDVWVKEIEGKMIDVNSLSKQDAVALIGAHTVGRHFAFGHWTQQPNIFNNEYFQQLKRVKDWLDSGNELGEGVGHPFGVDIRPNWFIDSVEVKDPEAVKPESPIMMLDADLALVLNAPELIEKYAADVTAWRKDFDDAYIVMSELGFATLDPPLDETNRRLLQRSEALLDDDFEFFQNLQILQKEQVKKIHAAFRRKL